MLLVIKYLDNSFKIYTNKLLFLIHALYHLLQNILDRFLGLSCTYKVGLMCRIFISSNF